MDQDQKSKEEENTYNLDKLTDEEIKLNIKKLLDVYILHTGVLEKLLIEFGMIRDYIEMFLAETIKRGNNVDDIVEQLKAIDFKKTNEVKKATFFKETKHDGIL